MAKYEKAENLKDLFKKIKITNWGEVPNFDIIINATSVGLKKNDEINLNLLNVSFLGFLFTFSWLFVHIKVQSDPKRFVGNFMIMTVLQFLAFLIYELILLFKIGSWTPIIHALMLCIVLIVLQAMALSKSRKLESP